MDQALSAARSTSSDPPTGNVSFWQSSLGPLTRRPPLPGPTEADVCVVGAGYTGLWTAWALRRAEPDLRVVIVEAAHVGFGASGRNGGWLSGLLPGNREQWAKGPGGKDAVISLQRHLMAAVDDVLAACVEEGIDIDAHKGGTLAVATTPAQAHRLRAGFVADQDWGVGPDDAWELTGTEVEARVQIAGARSGVFSPHCARIHPAKLVRGLAEAVERAGVTIFEDTPATGISPHLVRTSRGDVRARWVVRATEGFSATLPGLRRSLLPMNSSMIVTEPLDEAVWADIGWSDAETLRDGAHAYAYAQRTADGRVAIGGRGVPYRFGSRLDRRGESDPQTARALAEALHRLFPATSEAAIDYSWCGVLGVARDWCPTVALDRETGLGWAGGYVGDGVTTAHLAGRTMADLITGADTELVRLPWVNTTPPTWEPEPLRWLGVQAIYALYRAADRTEADGRPKDSGWAVLADRISGRP